MMARVASFAIAWIALGGCTPPTPAPTYTGRFVVRRDAFGVWDGARHRPIRLRGLNVTGTRPGDYADDSSLDAAHWLDWMKQWAEGGINTVRLYRLLEPSFYEALVHWNERHPDLSLYLVQGIYLEEERPGDASADLAPRAEGFDAAIAHAVDCVHGACEGYRHDSSRWVIAWLPGREISAHEVRATREAHPEITALHGAAFDVIDSDAATVWCVARLDGLIAYERARYGAERPIGFSSWPVLDPLEHPTEAESTGQDSVSIDFATVDATRAPAGHFASYHAYPYYPDFVNQDPEYRRTRDPDGTPNAYRAYLAALRAHHRDQAVVIAEFGVPSSVGRAYPSASQLPQGGLDERAQGQAAARMLRDIEAIGAAGAIWFQWEDGWFKGAWVNARRAFPRDRYPLWHDLLCPEQSYGLLAYDEAPSTPRVLALDGSTEDVAVIRASHTSARLIVRVELARDWSEPIEIALDVLDPTRGEPRMQGGATPRSAPELSIVVAPDAREALLHTTRCLDLARVAYDAPPGSGGYRSRREGCGGWALARWVVEPDNRTVLGVRQPDEVVALGRLRVRRDGDRPTSLDAVIVERRAIELRLPWNLALFADPSARMVIDDDPATRAIEATPTDGVAVAVAAGERVVETSRYVWPTWDEPPATRERIKESARVFFDHLRRTR